MTQQDMDIMDIEFAVRVGNLARRLAREHTGVIVPSDVERAVYLAAAVVWVLATTEEGEV